MVDNTIVSESERSEPRSEDFRYVTRIAERPVPKDLVERLWQKIQQAEFGMDDPSRGHADAFVANFFRPNVEHYIIGQEDGYACIADIVPHVSATVYYSVWSKDYPTKDLIAGAMEVFSYLFSTYELVRLSAVIPACSRKSLRLAALLGFRYEGEIRKGFLYGEKYYGMLLYGMLREEFQGTVQ